MTLSKTMCPKSLKMYRKGAFMNSIIITLTDKNRSFLYDLEVPAELESDKLKDDIVEALNGYNPNLLLKTAEVELLCNRTGKQLLPEETLESAGVWNGDYITIVEV